MLSKWPHWPRMALVIKAFGRSYTFNTWPKTHLKWAQAFPTHMSTAVPHWCIVWQISSSRIYSWLALHVPVTSGLSYSQILINFFMRTTLTFIHLLTQLIRCRAPHSQPVLLTLADIRISSSCLMLNKGKTEVMVFRSGHLSHATYKTGSDSCKTLTYWKQVGKSNTSPKY